MKRIFISTSGYEKFAMHFDEIGIADIRLERLSQPNIIGNIYIARVTKVLPELQSAFVDFGSRQEGFLPFHEIPGFTKGTIPVHEGEKKIIQVIKEAYGTKGAKLTANITIPGHHFVFLPFGEYIACSKRIPDHQKEDLKNWCQKFLSDSEGLIIRTSAQGREGKLLSSEIHALKQKWEMILASQNEGKVPICLFEDALIPDQFLRKKPLDSVDEVWFDDAETYRRCKEEYREVQQKFYWKHHDFPLPFSLDVALDQVLSHKVTTKEGVTLHFDSTEACHVIDVNSNHFRSHHQKEDFVRKTNVIAAQIIARHIRLRNLSGIILIDFIDMKKSEHREEVIKQLSNALKNDPLRTEIYGFTKLGMLEMTRKREGKSLALQVLQTSDEQISYSLDTWVYRLERKIRELGKGQEAILVDIRPELLKRFLELIPKKRFQEELGLKLFFREKSNLSDLFELIYIGTKEVAKERML
ncbi:ribonuclease E/G [Bacillaceae bacterium S4-13-58]